MEKLEKSFLSKPVLAELFFSCVLQRLGEGVEGASRIASDAPNKPRDKNELVCGSGVGA